MMPRGGPGKPRKKVLVPSDKYKLTLVDRLKMAGLSERKILDMKGRPVEVTMADDVVSTTGLPLDGLRIEVTGEYQYRIHVMSGVLHDEIDVNASDCDPTDAIAEAVRTSLEDLENLASAMRSKGVKFGSKLKKTT